MVVGRVSLGLKGSGGRVRNGGVCVGVRRDDMVSSGGKVLVKCPCGEHMGLGGVSFRRGGGGSDCVRVWEGYERDGMVVGYVCVKRTT